MRYENGILVTDKVNPVVKEANPVVKEANPVVKEANPVKPVNKTRLERFAKWFKNKFCYKCKKDIGLQNMLNGMKK